MMSSSSDVLRIAIQKSGRLSERSFSLLSQCGIDIDHKKDRLLVKSMNYPVELMMVRDDDIPAYVHDGVCDLGIVGQNVLAENLERESLREIRPLGFGYCRLSIAADPASGFSKASDLAGKRIATSYPNIVSRYLKKIDVKASIITISGSVEIAPSLDIADLICDIVSTGGTLRANGLREFFTIFESQAVVVAKKNLSSRFKEDLLNQLLQRLDGVIKAQRTKYIMMNAPIHAIEEIKAIIPGMEDPTIVPLTTPGKVAIHAVAPEPMFWETMERLKKAGASSILVVPIEKIIE
jgi:ATP phosphoribosyltransferase